MGSLRNGQFVYVNNDFECPPAKRARPNFFKCDQCRKSRVKCEPEDRIWPDKKCNHCNKRNWPCSPNTRQKKRPPQLEPTPTAQTKDIDTIANFPEFLHAIQHGLTTVVRILLNHSHKNDWCSQSIDEDGKKAIHEAAGRGHSEIVRLLIEHGVSPDEKTNRGRTPLWEATTNGHYTTVNLLIQFKASVYMLDCKRQQVIHQASFKGFLDIVRLLVQHGADVEARTELAETPLFYAVKGHSLDVAKFLIANNADLSIKSKARWRSSLHLAVQEGDIQMIDLLINSGAGIDTQDDGGRTPLALAARRGHVELVTHLISRGASLNHGDNRNLLYGAVSSGMLDLVSALLTYPEYLKDLAHPRMNILTIASRKGHIEIVQLLFDAGADVNIGSMCGEVPLVTAAGFGMICAVRLLIQLGADVNVQDKDGETALFRASRHGKIEAVALLIQANANVNLQNGTGKTALYVASVNGHKVVVEALITAGAQVKTDSHCSLLAASRFCRHAIVEIFLKNRADPNSTFGRSRPLDFSALYYQDMTPIFYAVQYGWSDTVIRLHALGADLDRRRSSPPYTPLCAAAAQGNLQMIGLLLACGADPDVGNPVSASSPTTPLGIAIINDQHAAVQLLLNHGVLSKQQRVSSLWYAIRVAENRDSFDLVNILLTHTDIINVEDSDGTSLLHKAVSDGSLRLVKTLLKSGAEVNKKNRSGVTPLILATFIQESCARLEFCKALIDAGGEVNGSEDHGFTALMHAVFNCDTALVRFLIRRGADREAKDCTGCSALPFAMGDSEIIYELAKDSTESISVSEEQQ